MDSVLDWRNLVFYIPLALGMVLAVGAGVGLGHGDHHPDGGPLPVTLRLMLGAFLFGGLGLLVGPAVRALTPGRPALGGGLAVLVALAATLVLGRVGARVLARRLPLFQSDTLRRSDLVGSTGRVVAGGVVQLRDRRGDLHQVRCRPSPGEELPPAGTEVVVLEYDEQAQTFVVEAI